MCGQGACASDDALYADVIPSDAVFIRWLEPPLKASAFGAQFDTTLAASGDFLPVSAALLKNVTAGSYFSVTEGQIIQEPARADKSKVHLVLLNTSQESAELLITENSAAVIGATEPNAAQSRAVNPIAVNLSVATSGGDFTEFDLSLRRGQNLTFLVTDAGVRLIENGFTEVTEPN